jgi:exodeoxyribonuclease VII small subunit
MAENKSMDLESMKFEDALKALSDCAEKLKSGKLSLDESIDVYNKSIMYYNRCKAILDGVQQKIELYRPETGRTEDFDL